MSDKALKAVQSLARPALNDIPQRLRLLADELPEGTRAVIVVPVPYNGVYGFGDALTSAEVIGYLTIAAPQFCPEK